MVEVIIVVAIIAILASIIIPKMTGARNRSQYNACKANIRNIATALELYANDNNGSYGPGTSNINAGCYLVTGGYLKPIMCPLGNRYYIWPNYPGSGVVPAGAKYLLFCYSETGVGIPHPGYQQDIPLYTPELGRVQDHW